MLSKRKRGVCLGLCLCFGLVGEVGPGVRVKGFWVYLFWAIRKQWSVCLISKTTIRTNFVILSKLRDLLCNFPKILQGP